MQLAAFTAKGPWYKGNLHTHTTNSDGRFEPQATVDLYAQGGYDFLAISDHNTVTETADLDARGMALIPSVELHGGTAEMGQDYHLVCIGAHGPTLPIPPGTAQEAVDYVRAAGRLCFSAHPYWSSLTTRDLIEIDGYHGVEIYNNTCERGIGRGHSEPHVDALLARGRKLLLTAVDDAHFGYWDGLGGWIMVRAAQLDVASLLDAIEAGRFYASTGPEIKVVEVRDDTVHVECSPVRTVALVTPWPGCGWSTGRMRAQGAEDPRIVETDLPLHDGERGFRVEVVDAHGRRAWTNMTVPH